MFPLACVSLFWGAFFHSVGQSQTAFWVKKNCVYVAVYVFLCPGPILNILESLKRVWRYCCWNPIVAGATYFYPTFFLSPFPHWASYHRGSSLPASSCSSCSTELWCFKFIFSFSICFSLRFFFKTHQRWLLAFIYSVVRDRKPLSLLFSAMQ